MVGREAAAKARFFADGVFARVAGSLESLGLPPLSETSVELLGTETHYAPTRRRPAPREVDLKIAAKHPSARGVAVFLKEMVGLALTAPPGLSGFAGARPKPTPVVRLFSFLLDKNALRAGIALDGDAVRWLDAESGSPVAAAAGPAAPLPRAAEDLVRYPLEALAFARSGDKGNKANIGVLARHRDFLPWIAAELSAERVAALFDHFLEPGVEPAVERFYMPGPGAFNFLLHAALGGGGIASLRADPQGKGYAQLLLCETVALPRSLAAAHRLPTQSDREANP